MAELRAELSSRLDASGLVGTLLGSLGGPTATLEGVTSPVAETQLSGAAQLAPQVDTPGIGTAIERVAGLVAGSLAGLPAAQEVIAPITDVLGVVETAAGGDLTADLGALLDRLSAELGGAREVGFLNVLERLGALAGAAPELSGLLRLLSTSFQAAGVTGEPSQGLGEALPAVVETARALGTLMQLESALAEGVRLTRIMAEQLDPTRVGLEIDALRTSFEMAAESVSALADAGGSPDAAATDAAVGSLLGCAARLGAIETLLAQSMGFGEATLVHFDIGRLEAEVRGAAAALGRVDADRIGRTVRALLDRIRPALDLDLPAPPAPSLEALLGLLEGRVAEVAGAISGLDVEALVEPVRQGIEQVTGVLGEISARLAAVTGALRAALEQVRQVVARLPLDEIASSIRSVLTPVTDAMEAMRSLVAGVEAALSAVCGTVTTALGDTEQAIDSFTQEIDSLLRAAGDFVDSLHLDQVVGQVADKVKGFADEIAKAQMQPYFDTAAGAIDTAADVIGAVPLGLLPDSMKADLDAAVAPIRAIDPDQVKAEIEELLAIREGHFELRGILDEALHTIQQSYAALLAEVQHADPRQLIAPIDTELTRIRAAVTRLAPQLTLQPLQDAVDRVKQALGAFDLRAALRPLDEAFAAIPALLDEYSPERLIQPLEERVTRVREALVSATRLREWDGMLSALSDQAKALLDLVDPAQLTGLIEEALAEVNRLLALAEQVQVAGPLGDLLATLLAGSGTRIQVWSFDSVTRWLTGGSGRQALGAYADAVAGAVAATRDAVQGVDLQGLSTQLGKQLGSMRSAIGRLPAGSDARLRLQAALDRVQVERPLASLISNQARYLTALETALGQAGRLQRTGLSQVDVTVAALQSAFSPATILQQLFARVLAQVGVTDLGGGVVGVARRILAVATPERLGEILTPIVAALKGRIAALLDAVLTPVRAGIADLIALVDAIDLAPVRQAVAAIVTEVRQQILALSPASLLGPVLDGFDALKTELAAFDPLQVVREVVEQLKAAVTRVLDKLGAERLLAQPIRIYDEILAALSALNLDTLLTPILDRLDGLAAQVDAGLGQTAEAVKRLQDALPEPGGGGGAASLAASVAVG